MPVTFVPEPPLVIAKLLPGLSPIKLPAIVFKST